MPGIQRVATIQRLVPATESTRGAVQHRLPVHTMSMHTRHEMRRLSVQLEGRHQIFAAMRSPQYEPNVGLIVQLIKHHVVARIGTGHVVPEPQCSVQLCVPKVPQGHGAAPTAAIQLAVSAARVVVDDDSDSLRCEVLHKQIDDVAVTRRIEFVSLCVKHVRRRCHRNSASMQE